MYRYRHIYAFLSDYKGYEKRVLAVVRYKPKSRVVFGRILLALFTGYAVSRDARESFLSRLVFSRWMIAHVL